MKKLKSILCSILMLCLILPASMMLSACGTTPTESSDRTMSLSINPEISFVVDKDNKIASISYGDSEDAGIIYANVNFENMDIKEAIKIFIDKAAVSGHIGLTATGTANDITVTVNGSVEADIADLESLAKTEIEKTFENLGVDVEVIISNLSDSQLKADLVEKANELYQEYTQSELSKMTRADLVELINNKQKQYKDLTYSQINALKTEIETKLTDSTSSLAILKTALDNAKTALNQAQTNLNNAQSAGINVDALQSLLDNAKVAYEEAMAAYSAAEEILIEAKKEFAQSEKAELLTEFKGLVLGYETELRDWLDSASDAGTLTTAQCDYWLNLINTNNGNL